MQNKDTKAKYALEIAWKSVLQSNKNIAKKKKKLSKSLRSV